MIKIQTENKKTEYQTACVNIILSENCDIITSSADVDNDYGLPIVPLG